MYMSPVLKKGPFVNKQASCVCPDKGSISEPKDNALVLPAVSLTIQGVGEGGDGGHNRTLYENVI